MTMLKYLIKTPRTAIRQDIADYNELRKTESAASYRCKMLYDAIHVRYGLYDDDVTSSDRDGCVVTSFQADPDFGRDCDPSVSMHKFVCKDFNYNYACMVKDCPHNKRNNEYFEALSERHEIRKLRKNFWKQKFANAR